MLLSNSESEPANNINSLHTENVVTHGFLNEIVAILQKFPKAFVLNENKVFQFKKCPIARADYSKRLSWQ